MAIQVNEAELKDILSAADSDIRSRNSKRVEELYESAAGCSTKKNQHKDKVPRFNVEQKRRAAIDVLERIKNLTQAQRSQVLIHAQRLNKV